MLPHYQQETECRTLKQHLALPQDPWWKGTGHINQVLVLSTIEVLFSFDTLYYYISEGNSVLFTPLYIYSVTFVTFQISIIIYIYEMGYAA